MEISVNGTPLAPRQAVTAAPYALTLAPGATIYGGVNGLNAISLYHSDAFTSAIYALHTATGGTALYGESDSGAGAKGVWGASSAGIGIYGSTDTGAAGVQGASTTGDGVRGVSSLGSGVRGESYSINGMGVQGVATGASITYGVFGQSDGEDGRAVFGYATSYTGSSVGVWGQSNAPNGYGIRGDALSASGSPIGVQGLSNSASGYGVYSYGRLAASGTKSFRIDHPFDPENKYLLHYATESPEPMNFYSGVIVTDSRGSAWVQLPDYFGEINKDFRYTLTVVDDTDSDVFVQAQVAREIRDNQFKIRTSAPGVKVSWRVDAVRNDRWVRKYGAPVEIEKQAPERGKYQHPELYGQPPEKGINYHAKRERPSPDAPPEATPR